MTAERTGSYPLMNIAQDFGVDYGDVLLVAQQIRTFRHGSCITPGRFRLATEAAMRVMDKVGAQHYGRVVGRIAERL